MFEVDGSWYEEEALEGERELHGALFGEKSASTSSTRRRRKRRKRTDIPLPEGPQELNEEAQEIHLSAAAKVVGESSPLLSTQENGHDNAEGKKRRKRREKVTSSVADTSPPSSLSKGKKISKFHSRMTRKMEGARFRWINEKLYTTTSDEARELFAQDPDLFTVYHSGFQTQVSKWPVHPLDRTIEWVKGLPGDIMIADLGCGEAKLAQSVSQTVYSFDLVALNSYVTACDMAHVPLSDGTVDVCIFCLSLMGTNTSDFVQEAHRILKEGGTLRVCEIESRIDSLEKFVSGIEAFGFKILHKEKFSKMFMELEFKAVSAARKTASAGIQLNPCIYKKR